MNRSVVYCNATNGAEGNFSFSSRGRWIFACWLHKDPGAGGKFTISSRRRGKAQNNNYSTSRRSPGVCETAEESAAGVIGWSADQNKMFDPGGQSMIRYFPPRGGYSVSRDSLRRSVFLFFLLSAIFPLFGRYERRGKFSVKDGRN